VYGQANPGTARALVEGYRDRAGTVPTLDLSAFWLTITAYLNWTYDEFCLVRSALGDERRGYVEAEVQQLIADQLTIAKLERVLEELQPVLP
jgi:hypothetical protein